jgi:very-short-patch-repair endonuclease
MRKSATPAEDQLWSIVRNRRFANYKFRRQVPFGPYIVDLMGPAAKLIIELDGSQHSENPNDVQRDAWLTARGFRTLRIWNNDLSLRQQAVTDFIWNALQEETKS